MTIPSEALVRLEPMLGAFLTRQRWYARSGDDPVAIEIRESDVLLEGPLRIWWLLVHAGADDYQVLVGLRRRGEPTDFLSGHDDGVVGTLDWDGEWVVYDAVLDPECDLELLKIVTDGRVRSDRARVMAAEQSNTSIVYDERLITKLFRRVRPGPNPDVAVTFALDEVGFNHVATPIAAWRRAGYDLAFVQQFLAGGAEGWALALTSLRDLYAWCAHSDGRPDDDQNGPEHSGGDFAAEAGRLGAVTARLHLAMATAFGRDPGDPQLWADAMEAEVRAVGGEDLDQNAARLVLDRLRSTDDPGFQTRVHGDYHLGQVMRTDTGWFVLDFEGEPARSLEERAAHRSPLKDVAGMLRSFQYATAVALNERAEQERTEALVEAGAAWEERNRAAFLHGYRSTHGIAELVPADDESFATVLAAFELEKAVYELGYERAYRPSWVAIPKSALDRLLAGAVSG